MKQIDNILPYDPGRHIFPDDAFYGDFFDIFNVKIDSSLKDISIFLEDVLHLETRLFSIFILFILSKVGYRQKWVNEEADEENDISRWKAQDWIDKHTHFYVSYEAFREFWSFDLTNNQGNMRVILVKERVARPSEIDISRDFTGVLDASVKERILVHVNDAKIGKNILSMFEKLMDKDRIYSSKAFLYRFIPNKNKRETVFQEWNNIRDGIISDFKTKYPFIRYSLSYNKFKAEKEISDAETQIRTGYDYCAAVRKMGFAAEILLQCIAEVQGIDSKKKSLGTLIRGV